MSDAFVWTPDKIETLRVMAARNQSAAEIAAVVGTSRSAVSGKAHREGVKLTGRSGHGPKTYHAAKPRALPAPAAAAPPPPPADPTDAEILAGAIPFFDRSNLQCAWIVEEAFPACADATCCGRPIDPEATQPYCAYHRRIGTQPMANPRSKSPAPARKLLRFSAS